MLMRSLLKRLFSSTSSRFPARVRPAHRRHQLVRSRIEPLEVRMLLTTVTITEFSAGITAGRGPFGIAAGPDGNVWFTENNFNQGAGAIGRITPAGVVTEFTAGISSPQQLGGITAGPTGDNSLWFVESDPSSGSTGPAQMRIGRISTTGTVVSETTVGAADLGTITVGPDGNLWFTLSVSSQIGRMTPAGVVTLFGASQGISPRSNPLAITTGPDGNLWFTQPGVNINTLNNTNQSNLAQLGQQLILSGAIGRIGRITPQGVVTEFNMTSGGYPIGITAGPDGNLWFTEPGIDSGTQTSFAAIGRITTSGVVTEFTTGLTQSALPGRITVGPDNNLWFTEPIGNRIGQATTAGVITEFTTGLTPNSRPSEIVTGPDGNLWFTEHDANQVARAVISSSTTIAIQAPSITFGNNGSVTVTASSTAGTPTGNISLSVDGGTAQVLALTSGAATFTVSGLAAGSHTLLASYAAQGNFEAATANGTLDVFRAATTTTISAPAITVGADGTVVVTVSSSAGTPSGQVSLAVDGVTLPFQTLDAAGTSTFTVSSPTVGTHTLAANYAAQGNFNNSTATGSLQVNAATAIPTTTSISAPAITVGANGSVTVTVSSGNGTPTGNISLSVDGGTAQVLQLNNAGAATFTVPNPSVGSHTLAATYAAQGNFGASSANGTLQVNAATAITTSTSISAPAITVGANGSVTVTVSSGNGTPTGNVSLSVDGGTAQVLQLNNAGAATFTVPNPSVGSHTLAATYAAQGNFGASSANGTLQVNAATAITTSTSISAPAITVGANGSVTVTVSSGNGTPTGNVSLSVDGGTAQVLQLNNAGAATFTVPNPSVGSHTLAATYAAQGNFGASSANGTLVVNAATSGVGLSLFLIGSDRQVYIEKFDTNLDLLSGPSLVQAGAAGNALSAVTLPNNAPVAFLVGLDSQVYKATFDPSGNLLTGFALTQAGSVRSIVATNDAAGNPLLLVVGADSQVYYQRFDVTGNLTAGYALVSPGAVLDLISSGPVMFAKGLDSQLYQNRFDGTTWSGYSLPAAGGVQSFSYSAGSGLLLAIGGDSQLYAQKFDASGNSAGWFLTAPGGVKGVTQDLYSGNAIAFVIGLDGQIYSEKFDTAGQSLGYAPTQPGAVNSIVSAGVTGTPALFAVGLDNQVYLLKFDNQTGEVNGNFTSINSGTVL